MTTLLATTNATYGVIDQIVGPQGHVFRLPKAEDGRENVYLIPVSGGNDSVALAILLSTLFPHINFQLIFTDTKAEPADIYERLTELEQFLGRPVTRLVPEKGLLELIVAYNGFLPSRKQRWCTRVLKIEALDTYLKQRYGGRDVAIWSFVGLRADEEERMGWITDDYAVQMVFPFKQMGLNREQIYRLIDATLGVARSYRTRSRSGCTLCPFQRRSELIGLFLNDPNQFEIGIQYEKYDPIDQARFERLNAWRGELVQDGVTLAAFRYPIPTRIDARTAHLPEVRRKAAGLKAGDSGDLFGLTYDDDYDDIYCAVAFLCDADLLWWDSNHLGGGVWLQTFVTYSTSLGGLTKALHYYYRHRLSTPEAWGISQGNLQHELKIGVYHLRVKKGLLDLEPVGKNSYTWQENISYPQLRHTTRILHEILGREEMEQNRAMYQTYPEGTWEHEQAEYLEQALNRLGDPIGVVHWSGLYNTPDPERLIDLTSPKARGDLDPDSNQERSVVCFACSI